MSTEVPNKGETPLQLTEGQQSAATSVIEILKNAPVPTLVFLEGMSGIGKSAVISSLEAEIIATNGIVDDPVNYDYLSIYRHKKRLAQHDGHIVMTGTPHEYENIQETVKKDLPEINFQGIVMLAMTADEIKSYIRSKLTPESPLTEEQLIQYSFGVPHLVDLLLNNSPMTDEIAKFITASYIPPNFSGRILNNLKDASLNKLLRKYLHITPSQELIDLSRETSNWWFGQKHIYSRIGYVLANLDELRRKGRQEESPFFVAPESIDIYTKMLIGHRPWLDIVVPDMKQADMVAFEQSFGFLDDEGLPTYDAYHYSVRPNAFFGDFWRKTSIWLEEANGQTHEAEHEHQRLGEHGELIKRAIKKGKFPLQGSPRGGIVYINAHAHGGQEELIAFKGWAIESFLQQKGIPYYADNKVYGRQYTYNPESKSIEYVDYDLRDELDLY